MLLLITSRIFTYNAPNLRLQKELDQNILGLINALLLERTMHLLCFLLHM